MTRTLIIGGGVIGLSVAYHLGKRGASDVMLLERNQLTSGTSWHAAGIVGPLRSTPNMTQLASHALTLFPALEAETGLSTGYQRTGGYWLARHTARLDELHRIADLGVTQGLNPQVVGTDKITVPQLDLSGHVGALHVPEDGNVNPVDLCMAYARAARLSGIDIREGVDVSEILTQDTRACGVALADGTRITADTVILCAGAWSAHLATTAGIALPLQAVEHMYVVTEPIADLPSPFPVIRDLDRGIYLKGDAGKLVIGGFEPDAKCWNAQGPEGNRPFLELPEDWEQFSPFMQAALDLMPALETVGIQHFMNGPESFTADTKPLVGECPQVDGLFVAAGMNSVGVMSSAGVGRALADWIVDGNPPMDMWEVDIARVDPRTGDPSHMAHRMQEAVSDLFAMHWPYKQPKAGRDLRQSAIHDKWASVGAVFGLTAGWERGLWYAADPTERDLPYTVEQQAWVPIANREAAVMQQGTALIDLSPFTKIDISGADALSTLNQLSTAQLNVAADRAVYTQLLNVQGGIEMDVTITRLSQDAFHLVSGAATRTRDLSYLRRHLSGDVQIKDRTEEYCTIGVMGAGSRVMLQNMTPNWVETAFGYATDIVLADVPCRLTRISFVGELGWEVTVSPTQAGRVFDALFAAGGRPLGQYALDGCRIEKGFKHWGHDLGPKITPLEAGLGFTIDWSKDFLGKDALVAQSKDGLTQRLVLFEIEGDALLLHDEPIYANGRHVGLTTSAAIGARTGLNLAFGLMSVTKGEPVDTLHTLKFHVRVAGQDYAARSLLRPPFDPSGKRMRA